MTRHQYAWASLFAGVALGYLALALMFSTGVLEAVPLHWIILAALLLLSPLLLALRRMKRGPRGD